MAPKNGKAKAVEAKAVEAKAVEAVQTQEAKAVDTKAVEAKAVEAKAEPKVKAPLADFEYGGQTWRDAIKSATQFGITVNCAIKALGPIKYQKNGHSFYPITDANMKLLTDAKAKAETSGSKDGGTHATQDGRHRIELRLNNVELATIRKVLADAQGNDIDRHLVDWTARTAETALTGCRFWAPKPKAEPTTTPETKKDGEPATA